MRFTLGESDGSLPFCADYTSALSEKSGVSPPGCL